MNLHLVTGGSRGLGAALAKFLADRGDDVVEISRSGGQRHPKIKSFSFDLADGGSKEELIKKIFAAFPLEKYQRISLTNNAGMVDPIKHIRDLEERDIARNIALNLVAPMALTAAFLKSSADFTGSRVIAHISSGVAKRPKASWAPYSVAKAGLDAFAQSLALDYAGNDRVKVITFEPGIIDTEMQALIRATAKNDFDEVERFQRFKDQSQLLAPEVVAEVLGKLILSPDLKSPCSASVYDVVKR